MHIEYVALSYVWGKPTAIIEDPLNAPEDEIIRLPSGRLSNPIEDAISITQMIGYRFLWADRHCINQQTSSEKHAQIAEMDIVYESAAVTIVAAAGADCGYGLPGVGHRAISPPWRGMDAANFQG